MPSFDCESIKKKPAGMKRSISLVSETTTSQTSSIYDVAPKKRSTSSLSALLQACEPQKSTELVVSKQKRQVISDWLQYRIRKGKPSAVILSGPSGCGKTAAIRQLAKENGFDVTEWITPIDQAMDENSNFRQILENNI